LINRRHSGFSVNHKVRIPAFSDQAREALSLYIARRLAVPTPLSLKKICIEKNKEATAISYTSENDFFQGKTETFTVMRFLLKLTPAGIITSNRNPGVLRGKRAGLLG